LKVEAQLQIGKHAMATTFTPATFDDLARTAGKAELVAGRIVTFMPSGKMHARVSKRILMALDQYVQTLGKGEAFGDNLGYALPTPLASGRQSFCPDVSYFAGPEGDDPHGFIQGPPTLAIEVRSEGDYGPAAEVRLAQKRSDYFEAGTLVVWDVDPQAKTIVVYDSSRPANPRPFHQGQAADAEPAVAGWRVEVRRLFE
jgi:Uma2 family endonuclease